VPYYDFACSGCDSVHEIKRSMADAGNPALCPVCAGTMTRIYDTEGVAVIPRPWGYSLKPGDPAYWNGYDNPLPQRTEWMKTTRGRRIKQDPQRSPQFEGIGIPHKS
jgi:putative FmdB family regulatory protein